MLAAKCMAELLQKLRECYIPTTYVCMCVTRSDKIYHMTQQLTLYQKVIDIVTPPLGSDSI